MTSSFQSNLPILYHGLFVIGLHRSFHIERKMLSIWGCSRKSFYEGILTPRLPFPFHASVFFINLADYERCEMFFPIWYINHLDRFPASLFVEVGRGTWLLDRVPAWLWEVQKQVGRETWQASTHPCPAPNTCWQWYIFTLFHLLVQLYYNFKWNSVS